MSTPIGFSGSSKTDASVTYFDINVFTDGSTHKVNSYKAHNSGKAITIPNDFAVTEVLLAAVPNNIKVHVHFESQNVTLNATKTNAEFPGAGLALGNATVSATM